MADERNPEHIHAAAMIRLQVALTALQRAAPCLERVTDASDDLTYATGEAGDALRLVRAAIDVALGRSTEIPDELRRSPMLADEATTTRFLSLPSR